MSETPSPPAALSLLPAMGEMSRRIREFDWTQTPLGAIDGWPSSLRQAVSICLHSRFPMFVWWGPHLINLYNDAYSTILGKRHPAALGRPADEVWHEIWDVVGTQAKLVMSSGEATWNERVLLLLERNGYQEETYFTWSYSAIPDGESGTGGVFCACTEETLRVRAERERDEFERALRESEDHFRHFVELNPQIPWTADPDGRLLDFSEKWLALTGLSRSDALHPNSVNIVHPEDRDNVLANWTHSLVSGMPHDVEYRVRTATGDYRWVRSRAFPRRDAEHDRITRWYGTTEDIHARKAGENAVREAVQRYRAFFESTRDAIVIYDPAGIVLQVNPSACRLYGFRAEQMVGRNARELMSPAALPLFEEFLRTVSAGGEFRCETVDQRMDGSLFPIEVVGTSFTDNGTLRMMSVIRDITDRKRATDRIGRLYAVAAALSEAMTTEDVARITVEQGIAALGASAGSLLLLSPDGQTLKMIGSVGYPPEVIGRFEQLSLDTPLPLTDAVRRGELILLHTPEERVERYPILRTVTPLVPTQSSACVPLMVGGRTIGSLGISFDRTHAMAPEDQEFALSLGRQCAQALERARLFDAERRARADAEAASRSKDEFLATLSHELRTPLNSILGWSQIVAATPGDINEVAQGLEVIERNARAQARIIDDLLDMNRIVSGKVRLEIRPMDLVVTIHSALEIARPAAEAKGIRLEARLDPDAGQIYGDPNRLQQVLWNLLSNAIKFTPRGGQVTMGLGRSEGYAQLIVKDTGEGIPEDFLPHVFDRFRQADATTTRRHGGLGLGLAIARQLLELHGGSIQAHSAGPGRGATFTIQIPTGKPDASAVEPAVITDTTSMATPRVEADNLQPTAYNADLSGLHVLVVDDEADARGLVQRLLKDRGARVIVASSAAAAIAHFKAERPDILVSDIGMPGGDGYSLIREVRSLDASSQVPIRAVAVTAYARKDDRERALGAGFQVHLSKPIDPQELILAIARLAGRA